MRGASHDAQNRPSAADPATESAGPDRREFLQQVAAGGAATVGVEAATLLGRAAAGENPDAPDLMDVPLHVNGKSYSLSLETRVSLLDALRERLELTGTKKGCDHGQCGACTVLIDGRRVLSCLTLAVMANGAAITTVEGLADGDVLHPVQASFLKHDAFQCGYCTPGQICSAVGLLNEGHAQTEDDVRELMSGNICRCGAYPNIVAAVEEVRRGDKKAP